MDSILNDDGNKPLRVVMFPWLAMGHILPYFELAKILAQKGHSVIFINTPKNIDLIPKTPKTLESFIKFVRLPLPHIEQLPEGAENTIDIPLDMHGYLKLAYKGLQDDVTEILKTSKPDWLFYDFAADWLAPIAKSLNIPCAHYSIIPSWTITFFDPPKDYIKSINQIGDLPPVFSNNYSPKWLPFQTTIHLKPYEIARVFSNFKEENSGKMDPNKSIFSCDLLIFRSSRELEGEWLDYISDKLKVPVIPVGLLPPSMHIRDNDNEDKENSNDWLKIKAWLDTQESSSVVYIAFGSEVRLSQNDLTELAHGIELSGLSFFWALKNLKEGTLELPNGFTDRTKDRGIVWETWAPQLKILSHKSIAGCMTHCGTGSIIEMLQFGHVLVTLPYYPDQCLFSRALEEKKTAIEVPRSEKDGSFTRDSVALTLRLAIVDEEGSDYRNNAKERGKIFSSKDLHNQYIEDFFVALQKYRVHYDN